MSATSDNLTLGRGVRVSPSSYERAASAAASRGSYRSRQAYGAASSASYSTSLTLVGSSYGAYGAAGSYAGRGSSGSYASYGAGRGAYAGAAPERGARGSGRSSARASRGERERAPERRAREPYAGHSRYAAGRGSRQAQGRERMDAPSRISRSSRASRTGAVAPARVAPARGEGAASVHERASAALASSPLRAPFAWVCNHLLVVGVIAAIVFAIGMLYTPLQSLYVARRANSALEVQLSEISATNSGLQSEVDALMTREGIEDEARRRGYVTEGETPVDMSGVDASGGASTDDSVLNGVSAAEQASDEPWYISLLDFVFQYNPETQGL